MKIDQMYKPEVAVHDDELRPALCHVKVTKHHAVASNGHILAVVPVTFEDGDTEGLVSPKVLKQARKVSKAMKNRADISLRINGKAELADGSTMPRNDSEEPFPRIGKFLRDARKNNTYTVGLNVNLLKDLADAIGSEEVVLTFPKDNTSGILVEGMRDSEGYGVLMPLRIRA